MDGTRNKHVPAQRPKKIGSGMKHENSHTSSEQKVYLSQQCQAPADIATYQAVVWGLGTAGLPDWPLIL